MFFKFLLLLFFGLLPRYFFPSGSVQIVDVIVLVLLAVVIVKKGSKIFNFFSIYLIPFTPFFIWILLVGLFFQINDTSTFKYTFIFIQFYYFYLLLFIFVNCFNLVLDNEDLVYFVFCLFVGTLSPFILSSIDLGTRNSLSFNNPNQLGYYSILCFSMVLFILNNKKNIMNGKIIHVLFGLIILVCHCMAFLSVSRSSLFAIGLLDLALMVSIYKNTNLNTKLLLVFVTGLLVSFSAALFFSGVFDMSESNKLHSKTPLKRFSEKKLFDKEDFKGRFHFLSKYKNSSEMLIGTSGRLNKKSLEVHNAIFGIFYYYGFIGGFFFFFGLAWAVVKLKFSLFNYVLLIPIGLYNMSHYGLRFRTFWVAIALLIAVRLFEPDKKRPDRNSMLS